MKTIGASISGDDVFCAREDGLVDHRAERQWLI